MNPVHIAALYHFFDFDDFETQHPHLQSLCDAEQLRGILLLAHEGINGTVAGPKAGIRKLVETLRADPRMAGLTVKYSFADENPFRRETVRVRLKNEIVTMGVPGIDPRSEAGEYVGPERWNELLADPEVVVIDVRNDYESMLGKFKGAIEPNTEDFRQFPQWVADHMDPQKQPKVAMYCTGGIRCEKATALMKRAGFNDVYHLEGGILKYLETTPQDQSQWEGECFVFDQRVSVDHALKPGQHALNFACGHPKLAVDEASDCPICAKRSKAAEQSEVVDATFKPQQ